MQVCQLSHRHITLAKQIRALHSMSQYHYYFILKFLNLLLAKLIIAERARGVDLIKYIVVLVVPLTGCTHFILPRHCLYMKQQKETFLNLLLVNFKCTVITFGN